MSKSENQELGILTVRLLKSLGQAVDTNELEWESRVGKIKSKTKKSFGLAVDTHELEWESIVGKINSTTSKVIWPGSRYKWVSVRVKSVED